MPGEDDFIDDELPPGAIDASSKPTIDVIKEMEQEHQDQRVADLEALLKLPEGRRILWWLIEQGNIYDSVFSVNAVQMAHNEGRREAAIRLVRGLEAISPHAFPNLMFDGNKDRVMEKAIQLQRIEQAKKREI